MPARNAKEYPGINSGEVHKLKRPIKIIENRKKATDTNQILRVAEFMKEFIDSDYLFEKRYEASTTQQNSPIMQSIQQKQ